ncbi:hypothetical protein Btru_051742 [Bulinus truncatus]|nr:hypothetical protein Btru_051742 [Bulinus truncatus]
MVVIGAGVVCKEIELGDLKSINADFLKEESKVVQNRQNRSLFRTDRIEGCSEQTESKVVQNRQNRRLFRTDRIEGCSEQTESKCSLFAYVWLNGVEIMQHVGGHLPFEAEIQHLLNYNSANLVTVAVNNTLTPTTLPPGTIQYQTDTTMYPPGYFLFKIYNGLFNYVEFTLIFFQFVKGYVDYTVFVGGGNPQFVEVLALDANEAVIAQSSKASDVLIIKFPHLWWPFGMNETVGYRYTLQVNVSGDIYRQHFGIRTIKVTDSQFLINDKPFYCHGVAKHEDSDFRGKGLDYTLFAKDFNMLRWMGVNCIRTSHYPYAEEILELADRQGVAVIDESPGVGIKNDNNMGNESLTHHLEVMSEMIRRDKNKPSVIMWSVANEPDSTRAAALPYFKTVIQYTRDHDPAHRPVTFVCDASYKSDVACQFVDVVCLNHYFGWYQDTGHLEVIQRQLHTWFAGFRSLHKKPIILTEYGADTVPGLHREPSSVFTEEYQVEFLQEYHKEFDIARQDFLVGEMVWNFADFMTTEGITRVVGNKKGLLTRQREPKRGAFVIRDRYNSIANGTSPCACSASSKYSSKPHSYQPPRTQNDQIIG